MDSKIAAVTGVILAGGRSRRMGGRDKGLLALADKPMIVHIIERFAPQVEHLMINANRNITEYRQFGHPVITDAGGNFDGPLAGMLSALKNAQTAYVLTVPCDSPVLAADYAGRMLAALQTAGAQLSIASDGQRPQPVFALLKKSLADDLQAYLDADGRKIDRWFERHKTATVDFSDRNEMFRNINTPEDLVLLATELKSI